MRCKCCDRVMSNPRLFVIAEVMVEEDTCSSCRRIAFQEWDYLNDHEYMFENLREGVTPPLGVDY